MRTSFLYVILVLTLAIANTGQAKAQPAVRIDSIKTTAGNCASSSITIYYSVRDSTGLNFDTGTVFTAYVSSDNFSSQTALSTTDRGKLASSYIDTLTTLLPATAGTYRIRFSTTAPAYTSQPFISQFIVNALPVILTPSVNQTYCSPGTLNTSCTGGTMTLPVTYTNANPVSFQWQSVAPFFQSCPFVTTLFPTSLTNSSNYSGVTTNQLSILQLSNTQYIRCVVTDQITGCSNSTGVTKVFFSSDPIIKSQPTSPSGVCPGYSAQISIVDSGGTPYLKRQWQYNNGGVWENVTSNQPPGFTYSGDTTTSILVNSGNNSIPGNYFYRCKVWAPGNGCDTVYSNSATFQVKGNIINLQPRFDTVCTGGAGTLSVAATCYGGPLAHQWEYSDNGFWGNVTNGTPNGLSYTGNTTANLNVNGLTNTSGVYWFRCKTSGNGCANLYTDSVRVVVKSAPSLAISLFTSPTICAGGLSTVFAIVSGGTGNVNYHWQYYNASVSTWQDLFDGAPAGSIYQGTNTNALTVSGILHLASHNYRVYISSPDPGCFADTSSGSSLTVVNGPIASSGAFNPIRICAGGASNAAYTYTGGTGQYTHQWQYNNGGNWENVVNDVPLGAAYVSTPTLSVSGILNSGLYDYRCIVSDAGVSCIDTGSTISLTVMSDLSITNQPLDTSICSGGLGALVISANGGTTTPQYQWQYNNAGAWQNVSNGTPANAVYNNNGAATYLQFSGSVVSGDYEYRCRVSSTGSGCDSVYSQSAFVHVLADPEFSIQPVPYSLICAGGSSTLQVSGIGGTPALAYQWRYNNGGNWVNVVDGLPSGAVYTGNNANQLVVDNINQIGTHNYQCIVTALGSGCNPKTSDIATVEVNPSPYFSQHPVNPPAICTSGSTVFFAEAFTGSLSASYKWQYNNGGIWQDVVDNIPSGATYAGADTNILYVSNIIANGDFEYRCIFFTNSLTCSSDTSLSARISVAPQPSFLTVSPGPQEICVGGSAGLNVTTAGGTDNTYQWQIFNNGFWSNIVNNTPAGVLYSGLNTDSLIFIGANADSGEYTFQCILISYGNGCVQSVSNPMTVIVHEDPAILPNTIPVESYACMNGTFDLTLQGNSPNLIYTWEYLSGTWDTVENNIPLNVTYTGQGTNVLSVQYNSNSLAFLNYRARVTRPLSGCNTQITGAFNILLSEQPYIASSGVPAYAAICDGGVEDFFVTVNGGISGGLSYQWDYADNPGFSNAIVAPGSGNSNTYGAIAAGYYRCTITSTAGSGCNTLTTDAGELAVRPDPQIELVATDTVLCSGETFEFTRQVYGGAGSAVFTLDSARQSNMIWGSVAVTDSVFEKIFSVSDTYFYRIIFNSLGSGCDVDTSNIIQLVSLPNPEAPIVSYNAAGICTGTQNADFVITNPQPSLNYNWHISPAETIHLNQSMTQAEISFLSAGAHTLEVTSSLNNGQCTTSSINNFSLSGNAPTGVDIVLTQPGNNLFCLNDNYYSYQWGFDYKTSGTRTIIPGVSSPIYTAGNTLDTINKAYWLKVCTSDGCCTRVYFNTKPFITGIGSSITNLFNVYPNPSNGILLLENTLSFPLSVEISSMDGKLVKRVDEFEQQTMVNINELADGIYLIAAYNKAGQRDLKKIVLLK